VVDVGVDADARDAVRVERAARVAAAGRAGVRRGAPVAELLALGVVVRGAALRARGAAAEALVAEAGGAVVVRLAAEAVELLVDALRGERVGQADLAGAVVRARLVRGDDEVRAEVAVDVRDDRVLVPGARRRVLAEEHLPGLPVVHAREALVGVDDL